MLGRGGSTCGCFLNRYVFISFLSQEAEVKAYKLKKKMSAWGVFKQFKKDTIKMARIFQKLPRGMLQSIRSRNEDMAWRPIKTAAVLTYKNTPEIDKITSGPLWATWPRCFQLCDYLPSNAGHCGLIKKRDRRVVPGQCSSRDLRAVPDHAVEGFFMKMSTFKMNIRSHHSSFLQGL